MDKDGDIVECCGRTRQTIEHVLNRPDCYIGSCEEVTELLWAVRARDKCMIHRDISYVPGLYKIFDAILVNAVENKQRDPAMDTLKVTIDPSQSKFKIWNNGKGIPVVEDETEKMYYPTRIFGHFSNSDDRADGGKIGYSARLCNIFCTSFVVETSSKEHGKSFKQTWTDNMTKTSKPIIEDAKGDDFTCVTFCPDLMRLKMIYMGTDLAALVTRRAYDVAACVRGVDVYVNEERVEVNNFKEYVDLCVKSEEMEFGSSLQVVYEKVSDQCEVAVTSSNRGFQQMSFVNSIATTKGGRHVDSVVDQCVNKLIQEAKNRSEGSAGVITPSQAKAHLMVFVNCFIEDPAFDSQIKDNLVTGVCSLGSLCKLSDQFLTSVTEIGIIEKILKHLKEKSERSGSHFPIRMLNDARFAGTDNSNRCTLILAQGEWAMSLTLAGLEVIGRDCYGVFRLKGLLPNMRQASKKSFDYQITDLMSIIGLDFNENYDDPSFISLLRYNRVVLLTDGGPNGCYSKGLFINFIHYYWPSLLRNNNFLHEFVVPVAKVTEGRKIHFHNSLTEFEEWKAKNPNWNSHRVKYYRGLGSFTTSDVKELFRDIPRQIVPFRYSGDEDDSAIALVFSKNKCDERKVWMANYCQDRKRRQEMNLPELSLYGKQIKSLAISDFINQRVIQHSLTNTIRAIPCLMDGFKPGHRKVIHASFLRDLGLRQATVSQLAAWVAEVSLYHDEEFSQIVHTIISLAQDFVGSNNINLLQPLGQFGTRFLGGRDTASPKELYTVLSPLARLIFDERDDALLTHLYDGKERLEPEWFCPIIPMVLVNGGEGVGYGYSTWIPKFDVMDIVNNLRRLLDGETTGPMIPSYRRFKGAVEVDKDTLPEGTHYNVNGDISVLNETMLEITELPPGVSIQSYKENVLDRLRQDVVWSSPSHSAAFDYEEHHTESAVRFLVTMCPEKMTEAKEIGLLKFFKLTSRLSLNNMVLFDSSGCIKHYQKVEDILLDYFNVRLAYYRKRKEYQEGLLAAECLTLDNTVRFIGETNDRKILFDNTSDKELFEILTAEGYQSNPIKAWKAARNKVKVGLMSTIDIGEGSIQPDFNYLIDLPLRSLTKERREELCRQKDVKVSELESLKTKTPKDLWREDLDAFCECFKCRDLPCVSQTSAKEQRLASNVKQVRKSLHQEVEAIRLTKTVTKM